MPHVFADMGHFLVWISLKQRLIAINIVRQALRRRLAPIRTNTTLPLGISMRIRSIVGAGTLTLTVALFNLGGCSASNTSSTSNGPASTLNIQPTPLSVPVNGTVAFSSNATNATAVMWTTNSGSLSASTGFSTTYTAPSAPPVYPVGSAYAQGQVFVSASTTATNACGDTDQAIYFTITAPSITAGISPTAASVALGTTLNMTAYAVGSVSNGVIVQVQGVTGGSAAYGTIALYPTYSTTQQYQYTAPAAMPMSGQTVTITVTSIADPTKSASAIITLH
jgi:hypothetical protein